MFFLREKVNVKASSNLILSAASYYTFRHRTAIPLKQVKENDIEIRTWIMVRMTKADEEG